VFLGIYISFRDEGFQIQVQFSDSGLMNNAFDGAAALPHHLLLQASFVSIGLIPTGIDKCNTKIMIDTIRDPDLFRVEN
jgi:hypothetical protein